MFAIIISIYHFFYFFIYSVEKKLVTHKFFFHKFFFVEFFFSKKKITRNRSHIDQYGTVFFSSKNWFFGPEKKSQNCDFYQIFTKSGVFCRKNWFFEPKKDFPHYPRWFVYVEIFFEIFDFSKKNLCLQVSFSTDFIYLFAVSGFFGVGVFLTGVTSARFALLGVLARPWLSGGLKVLEAELDAVLLVLVELATELWRLGFSGFVRLALLAIARFAPRFILEVFTPYFDSCRIWCCFSSFLASRSAILSAS